MTQFFQTPAAGSAFPVEPPPPGQPAFVGIAPNISILQAMGTGALPAQAEIYNLGPPTTLAQALSSGQINGSALASTLQFAPTYTITAITNASSGVVTVNAVSAANVFTVGATLYFSGIVGMTQLNNTYATVTATGGSSGAWTATFNVATTSYGTFTSTSGTPTVQVGSGNYGGN